MRIIILQVVLFILMLNGSTISGSQCNSCIHMNVKGQPPEILKDSELISGSKCAKMERCNDSLVQGEVSKCVIYRGSGSLHLSPSSGDKSKYLVNAEIIVRKCEKIKIDIPSKCTNMQDDGIADFSNVFNSYTNGYAEDKFVNMSFTGMRCVGDAYYRPMAPLALAKPKKKFWKNNYKGNGEEQWNWNKKEDFEKKARAVGEWIGGKIKNSGMTSSTTASILTVMMTLMVRMMCL